VSQEASVVALDQINGAERRGHWRADDVLLAQMPHEKREGTLIAAFANEPLPTPAEKRLDSFLIQLLERNASLLQPPTQISHEPDFVTRRRFAVALLSEKSGEAVQVRSQGARSWIREHGDGAFWHMQICLKTTGQR